MPQIYYFVKDCMDLSFNYTHTETIMVDFNQKIDAILSEFVNVFMFIER